MKRFGIAWRQDGQITAAYLNEHQNGDLCLYSDAQSELEKLRAEVEALRAKLPRWIPCSERLPEINDLYLCLIDAAEHELIYYYPSDGIWADENGEYEGVTHWKGSELKADHEVTEAHARRVAAALIESRPWVAKEAIVKGLVVEVAIMRDGDDEAALVLDRDQYELADKIVALLNAESPV